MFMISILNFLLIGFTQGFSAPGAVPPESFIAERWYPTNLPTVMPPWKMPGADLGSFRTARPQGGLPTTTLASPTNSLPMPPGTSPNDTTLGPHPPAPSPPPSSSTITTTTDVPTTTATTTTIPPTTSSQNGSKLVNDDSMVVSVTATNLAKTPVLPDDNENGILTILSPNFEDITKIETLKEAEDIISNIGEGSGSGEEPRTNTFLKSNELTETALEPPSDLKLNDETVSNTTTTTSTTVKTTETTTTELATTMEMTTEMEQIETSTTESTTLKSTTASKTTTTPEPVTVLETTTLTSTSGSTTSTTTTTPEPVTTLNTTTLSTTTPPSPGEIPTTIVTTTTEKLSTLINIADETTTSITTTDRNESTTTMMTQLPTKECSDILFLLDSSGNVIQQFEKQKKYIEDIVNKIEVQQPRNWSLITYSGRQRQKIVVPLPQKPNSQQFLDRLEKARYLRGVTATGAAISVTTQYVLQKGKNVKVVIVTDGFSFDDVEKQSEALRTVGAETFVTGRYTPVVKKVLLAMAGSEKNVFFDKKEAQLLEKLKC